MGILAPRAEIVHFSVRSWPFDLLSGTPFLAVLAKVMPNSPRYRKVARNNRANVEFGPFEVGSEGGVVKSGPIIDQF